MPNWCSNGGTITGSEESIQKIKDIVDLIPPQESQVFTKLVGEKTDNDTLAGSWGTKWDVCPAECYFEYTPTTITFSMETAWAPPTGFYELLCKTYGVKVECWYSEPGCDFSGESTYHPDGTTVDNCYGYYEGLYHIDNEGWWLELDGQMKWSIENDTEDGESKTGEEYAKEHTYITEEDRIEVAELYNDLKLETNGTS